MGLGAFRGRARFEWGREGRGDGGKSKRGKENMRAYVSARACMLSCVRVRVSA